MGMADLLTFSGFSGLGCACCPCRSATEDAFGNPSDTVTWGVGTQSAGAVEFIDLVLGVEYRLQKHQQCIADRGFGFDLAALLWDRNVQTIPGHPQDGEIRSVSRGAVDGYPLTVVWTWRNGRRRIISAHKTKRKER